MRRLIAPCALAFLVAVAGAAEPPAGFVERIKAAREARGAGDTDAALRHVRKALDLRPQHPTGLYELAATHAAAGEADKACDALYELDRMGLTASPEKDPQFKRIAGNGCLRSVQKALDFNRRELGRELVHTAFKLPLPRFIPEGLAYERDSGDHFIGGVHEGRILRVRDDAARQFVAPGEGGLWAPLGMDVDRERGLLWVATAAIPQLKGVKPEELGRTALLAYDVATGAPKGRYPLNEPGEHQLGDVMVTRDGEVFATDSRGGMLYQLDVKKGFRALTKPGALVSPQGMAMGPDRRWLYVADYTQGLFRYDRDKRELIRVETPRDICTYGIDGLYYYQQDLIAVQNGVQPHRLVRLELSASGRRVKELRVLASNLRSFDEPTLGAIQGKRFYFIANSQWNKFDDQGRLPADRKLRGPVVQWLELLEPSEERIRSPGGTSPVQPPPPGGGLPSLPVCPPGLC
jgi:sugar lactone lactonase YvrE